MTESSHASSIRPAAERALPAPRFPSARSLPLTSRRLPPLDRLLDADLTPLDPSLSVASHHLHRRRRSLISHGRRKPAAGRPTAPLAPPRAHRRQTRANSPRRPGGGAPERARPRHHRSAPGAALQLAIRRRGRPSSLRLRNAAWVTEEGALLLKAMAPRERRRSAARLVVRALRARRALPRLRAQLARRQEAPRNRLRTRDAPAQRRAIAGGQPKVDPAPAQRPAPGVKKLTPFSA